MKTFKTFALTALAAGAMALPLAAHAAGYGDSSSTTSNTSVDTAPGNTTRAKTDSPASSSTTGAAAGISAQQFKNLDSDKSGSLSSAEFSKYTSASIDFGTADKNSDGSVTLSELQSTQGGAH